MRILNLLFMNLMIFGFQSLASDQTHYNQGKSVATEQLSSSLPNPNIIPGFQGTGVPESHLSSGSIKSSLEQKLTTDHKGYETVIQSQRERLSFHLDPNTDPLFTTSDQIADAPLETLKATTTEIHNPVVETKTRHTCEEPGDPYTASCIRDLVVTVDPTPPSSITHFFGYAPKYNKDKATLDKIHRLIKFSPPQRIGPYYNPDCNENISYFEKTYIPDLKTQPNFLRDLFEITGKTKGFYPLEPITEDLACLKPKRVTTSKPDFEEAWGSPIDYWWAEVEIDVVKPVLLKEDEWVANCDALEEKVDQGLCTYGERQCTSGPATRIIHGKEITRPCWQERQLYHCSYPSQNTCGELKYKGCVQVHSRCLKKVEDTCIAYEQTYECTERTGGEARTQFSGGVPWCLDGDCVEQGYAPNKDMADSLSKLMIFKEMQKDMKDFFIFNGTNLRCRRYCLSFLSCCQKKSGWGKSIGLASCDEDEKKLSEQRSKDLCVYVGTYCAKRDKLTKICKRKESRYCCFETKLARLVQEQGRKQLGLTFGEARNPICRGFTTQELTRIDFEKIDLSSLFSELFAKFQTPDVNKLSQDFNHDWKTRAPKYQSEQAQDSKDDDFLKKLKEERETQIQEDDKDVAAF